MTVKELIEKLKDLPENAKVLYLDGEYKDSTSEVKVLNYTDKSSFGREGNTVILSVS